MQTRRHKPHAPAGVRVFPFNMQESVVAKIFGAQQSIVALQKSWTAHRGVELSKQKINLHPFVVTRPVAQRHVYFAAGDIHQAVGAVDPDLDIRCLLRNRSSLGTSHIDPNDGLTLIVSTPLSL